MHKQAHIQARWSMEKHWARFSKATITSGTNTHTKHKAKCFALSDRLQLLGKGREILLRSYHHFQNFFFSLFMTSLYLKYVDLHGLSYRGT